jgi:hypothetical protein
MLLFTIACRLPANKSHLPGAQAMAFITSKASHLRYIGHRSFSLDVNLVCSIASTSSAGASIENLTAHSHTASTDSKRGVPTPAISVPVANDPATPVKTRQRAETVAAGNAATPKQLAVSYPIRILAYHNSDFGGSSCEYY